jgi:hypothetical protein
MTTFDPQEESVADYPPERCVDIVRDAAGTDVDIEILGVDSWHMSAQVASAMRDGRIFLVGDSAHRFPPTGGLGLNTGVADAHNLCWKLGAVDDGWASAELLDTYEIERKPIAEVNCEQSTTNAFKMVTLADALDLRGSSTTERMLTSLHDPEQETAIAAAVADQATHFDMIGLQLGYVYAEGAVSRTGEPPPPISNPSVFEPRGEVGARLPHAWTDDDRSTLDLVASDGFTLISFGDHQRWRELADAIATPITVVAVGHDVSVTDDWRQRCGLGASGVMLVRPDQHIAWRSDTIDHDSDSSLGAALTTIVGS